MWRTKQCTEKEIVCPGMDRVLNNLVGLRELERECKDKPKAWSNRQEVPEGRRGPALGGRGHCAE